LKHAEEFIGRDKITYFIFVAYIIPLVLKITSVKNPHIKRLLELQAKSRERKKQGRFVVEGLREIGIMAKAGWKFEALYFCADVMEGNQRVLRNESLHAVPQFELDRSVYEKVAYRDNTEGLIAIGHTKEHLLTQIQLPENPLVLVCEAVEKPGNLGAILRTADAAKVDAILICDPLSDVYNPNVLRSSVGCLFSNQVVVTDSQQAIAWLNQQGISIYATALTASLPHWKVNMQGPTALVLGTEATGLSPLWLKASHQNIVIPMGGTIDSLNVSVAAAVVLFEARRQRDN
jgi:RNA methyltransferase, TrmH family